MLRILYLKYFYYALLLKPCTILDAITLCKKIIELQQNKKQSTKHIIIPVHQYFPKEMFFTVPWISQLKLHKQFISFTKSVEIIFTSKKGKLASSASPPPPLPGRCYVLCCIFLCLSCWAAFCQLTINEYCIVLYCTLIYHKLQNTCRT